jgi:hypothetical protein
VPFGDRLARVDEDDVDGRARRRGTDPPGDHGGIEQADGTERHADAGADADRDVGTGLRTPLGVQRHVLVR